MGDLDRSAATLRVMGDDLLPSEVTQLLGREPSTSQAKGEVLVGKVTGTNRIAKFGLWCFDAKKSAPGDLESQIQEILAQLTDRIEIWRGLAQRYEMDLFCGAFMKKSNDGFILSANTLWKLGQRGIDLSLDIYGPNNDEEEASAA